MKNSTKYMDIVDWTIEQITTGAVRPGDRFLSECDLSEQFGFSRQTVRRALEVLEQQNYITRIQGSGTYITKKQVDNGNLLYTNRTLTKVIGVISTHLDTYIFPSIIQGIENVITENGYAVQLASTKNLVEGEIRALQIMLENRLDGLIVEPTKSGLPCINLNLYQSIIQRGIPLVFLDTTYPELSVPYVALDDVMAGYVAVQHLLRMGHRDIAGIFTHSDRQGHLRYKGYVKALIEQGLPIRDDKVFWYSKENMQQILNSPQLLEGLKSCTAALCYNDSLALMLINLLQQNGRQVPDDFSVVGIDNSEMASISSLTSIIHPAEQLGVAAAKLLLSMINGEEGESILFTPQLVPRNSVQKLQ